MSNVHTRPAEGRVAPTDRRTRSVPTFRVALLAATAVLAVMPFYAGPFWLQLGCFVAAAAVAALGLDLLTGVAGQLSLAHAFFVSIGAYGYSYLAAEPEGLHEGAGWPPLLAAVVAVTAAAVAGALFSPIAGRVRGLYLGVASISLVFIGQHILNNATSYTGGGTGRAVPAFEVAGLYFGDDPGRIVLGVPFGRLEVLWYLSLIMVALATWTALNLFDSRIGRSFLAVRVSETAAGVYAVNIRRTRTLAFVVSSVYAAIGGVLMALAFGQVVPSSFGLGLSISFLMMIVLGGLGSVSGAVLGATLVTVMPEVLAKYSSGLPLVDADTSGSGIGPDFLSNVLFGLLVVGVLVANRGGVADWLGLRR